MSNEAAAKPGDTVTAKAEGTEDTAIGAAGGAGVEGAAAAAELTGQEAPKAEDAGKTAFSMAGEDQPADEGAGAGDDAGKKGEGEAGKKDGDENKGDANPVEEALAEVELPDNFIVSDEDKGAVAEIAKAHNLSKDAVKDLIALQAKREQARMEQTRKANQEFVGKMKSQALALPKETLVGCNKFVQKFGSEGLKAKMADPAFYIGNDVDIINAFALAQKAVDGGFVDGASAGGGAAKSAGEVLYN